MKKVTKTFLASLLVLSLIPTTGLTTISEDTTNPKIQANATPNEGGRTINQTQDFPVIYVGDILDLDDYIEVVPGDDEANSVRGDISYSFKVYSDSRGEVLERYKDITKLNSDDSKVIAIASGVANVLVESQGATLMLSFYVYDSDTLTNAKTILDQLDGNFTIYQNQYDSEGNITGKTSIYTTENYIYSEVTSYGYIIHDNTLYRYWADGIDSDEIKIAPSTTSLSDFEDSQIDPSDIDFRELHYYTNLVQQDYPFAYAYLPMDSSDSYLNNLLSTFQIPSSFAATTYGGDSVTMTVVGLGLNASSEQLMFYPLATYNDIAYVIDPFYLDVSSIGTTVIEPVETYLETEREYPTSVTEEVSTALTEKMLADSNHVTSGDREGYNYSITSSAEFLDVNGNVLEEAPSDISVTYTAFDNRVVKITKDGMYCNFFNVIATNTTDAAYTEGGYMTYQASNGTTTRKYFGSYVLDSEGNMVKGNMTSTGYALTTTTTYITYATLLNTYLYSWNPYSALRLYLPYLYRGGFSYYAGENHISAFGSSDDSRIYNLFYVFGGFLTSYPEANANETATEALGALPQSDIDIYNNDDGTIDIDIMLALTDSNNNHVGYYHLSGSAYDYGTTTIDGLSTFIDSLAA